MGEPTIDEADLVARSFVVRALLEPPEHRRFGRRGHDRWHGYITDAETGERLAWDRVGDVARFIERRLATELDALAAAAPRVVLPRTGAPVAAPALEPRRAAAPAPTALLDAAPAAPRALGIRIGGLAVAAPTLTDVVTDLLTVLGQRLPAASAGMPEPNVSLERVRERVVGLGNHAGDEPTGTLGTRTLRGGRLDARVRFQLWGLTSSDVDGAVQTLHTTLLDDTETLRAAGFLRMAAAETTLSEPVPSAGGWRKTTSYDVLYEYRYVDSDDASSLIARIPVTVDPEQSDGPGRERATISDDLVRWDDEQANPLVVRGPLQVSRVAALAFVAGPALGGTVTFARTSGTGAAPVHHADLTSFLDAVGGVDPAETDADVALDPAAALAALGPATPALSLGDWDTDGVTDAYDAHDRRLDEPLVLATAADRFTVTYTPPPGPTPGLDQSAVVYLRVNPP